MNEKAIFAAGCFWGVEYYFQNAKGVISTKVGYTGGNIENPSYEEVCCKTSGHYEAIEVVFDNEKTSYEEMAKLFFSVHDFSQENGQGPDIGPQYRSAIFYIDKKQKETAENLIKELENRGHKVATEIKSATLFYPAENYHQRYYEKTGKEPYCHIISKIF